MATFQGELAVARPGPDEAAVILRQIEDIGGLYRNCSLGEPPIYV
jgi:hypothetical protein